MVRVLLGAGLLGAATLSACGGSASVEPLFGSSSAAGGSGGMGGAATSSATVSSSVTLDASAVGAGGAEAGSGGTPLCGTELVGVVRDFHVMHPDFEKYIGADPGMVAATLGADKKPVYAGNPVTPSTTGKANFDQWFRDVDGVNLALPVKLTLSEQGNGIFGYDNQAFFPIDGQGFGNEGFPHNFHFTFELHTQFIYKGFEVFEFSGDDDLWVYVNGKLAIDLGGIHGNLAGSVDMPARAAELGLVVGKIYPLDLFFAERHSTESHFKVQTTIGSFTDCGNDLPQ